MRVLVALLTGLVTLVYLLAFRDYGLNVEDEGTLLYQMFRVARGEVPYVDFQTGYTPGFFYLGAMLWRASGDLASFRALLALVHAMALGGVAYLLASLTRPSIAIVVPLLYLAFIPVYPGEFAAFNVPYPAWFASLGWVMTALAIIAFTRRRDRRLLAIAGAVAAATFAMKPNAGVFALAAATACLLAVEERGHGFSALSATLWVVLATSLLAGVWAALGARPGGWDVALHLVPLALAIAALARPARMGRRFLVGDVLALTAPFAFISGAWLVYFWLRLGGGRLAREVLLVGSGAAELYYAPYPAPQPWALAVTAAAVVFALAGAVLRRWRVPLGFVAAATVVALVAVGAAVWRRGVMPEGATWSLIWQLESAAFLLVLTTHVAGVLWLWQTNLTGTARPHTTQTDGASGSAAPGREASTILLLFALFMHLQLYPRADFMHLMGACLLSTAFAGVLLGEVVSWWEQGLARRAVPPRPRSSSAAERRPRRPAPVAAAVLTVLAAAIALRVSPSLTALGALPRYVLPFEVAPVGVERVHAADLRALGAAGTALARAVPAGESSLAFPAIDVLLFLAGARNPTPYAYFYPGRPDHREEAALLDVIAAAPPAALTSLNRRFTFFEGAPSYYFLLRRFARAHYVLGDVHGRFDILVRDDAARVHGRSVRDRVRRAAAMREARVEHAPGPVFGTRDEALAALASAAPERRIAAAGALAAYSPAETAPALLAAAASDDAAVRAAALAALLSAIVRHPSVGLESYVKNAGLDRRRQILLVRAIRDARDERAASYLFAAATSGEPRLAEAALDAMERTGAELVARRHLWVEPVRPNVWPAHAALTAAVRSALADPTAPSRLTVFAAQLASALRDTDSVPALRRLVETALPTPTAYAPPAHGTSPMVASAAAALADLAPAGVACQLVALLGRGALGVDAILPSVLLELAEGPEPARSEARQCVAAAVASPGSPRATAVWIAAGLGDPAMAPALRSALVAPEVEVRRSAAWALGELPADTDTKAALAAAASRDADEMTRWMAAAAAEKHAGSRRRVFAAARHHTDGLLARTIHGRGTSSRCAGVDGGPRRPHCMDRRAARGAAERGKNADGPGEAAERCAS